MKHSSPSSTRNGQKKSASSRRVKPAVRRERASIVRIRLEDLPPLTEKDYKELRALDKRPIDFSDIPEITDEEWGNAVLMPPVTDPKWKKGMQELQNKSKKKAQNKPIELALEPDVYRWFKSQGKQGEQRINALLKDYIHMLQQHTQ